MGAAKFRGCRVLLCLVLAGGCVAARCSEPLFTLPPGPHAVGFRAVDLRDYSRTYRSAYTATGEVELRERTRPIQTSIWYPARRSTRPGMRFGDYVVLGARQDGPATAEETAAYVKQMLTAWGADSGAAKARVEAVMAARLSVVRDAAPAPGRHPVVIYNAGGGQPSWDNSVLCEYLASHGYVVIASPNTWNWSRMHADSQELISAEASARDVEFHLGYAHTLPFVDPAHVALMGYSWGGQAAVMVALRNTAIAAIVSLDGSEANMPTQWEQAAHHDPAAITAAYLSFNSSIERTLQSEKLRAAAPMTAAEAAKEAEELPKWRERLAHPPIFEGIRSADAYHVVMQKFHHGNFASHWSQLLGAADWKPGEPTPADDQAGYSALSIYTRHFLDAYVRGDNHARQWLARTPEEAGLAAGTMQISYRPAAAVPAPAIDAFARYQREHGFAALQERVGELRRAEPAYGLSAEDTVLWADLLVEARQPERAIEVLRWAAALDPKSQPILGTLCARLEGRKAEQVACYRLLQSRFPDDPGITPLLDKAESG
jgi:dienelactone hydrolase